MQYLVEGKRASLKNPKAADEQKIPAAERNLHPKRQTNKIPAAERNLQSDNFYYYHDRTISATSLLDRTLSRIAQ